MPPRETEGSKNGWIRPTCDRLVLKRGKRSEKNGDRPSASEQAVETRAIFNKDRELLAQPVKVGDMVLLGVAATHRQRHTFQVERESQLLV